MRRLETLLFTLTLTVPLTADSTSSPVSQVSKAWQVIKDGRLLNRQAQSLATETLKDPEPRVRAAASALGQMKARSAAAA